MPDQPIDWGHNCGCWLGNGLHYCAVHGAAPRMLDALRDLTAAIKAHGEDGWHVRNADGVEVGHAAELAIAEAEKTA